MAPDQSGATAGALVEIRLGPEGDATRVSITESGAIENPELEAGAWRNSLELLRRLASET